MQTTSIRPAGPLFRSDVAAVVAVKRAQAQSQPSPAVDDETDVDADRYETTGIPFQILARTGRGLGSVWTLGEALECYNRWSQATAIVLGKYVVCQRKAVRQ